MEVMTVERAMIKLDGYIHRQAWRCADKMPRSTVFSHDDLVGEAHEVLVRCLPHFIEGRGIRLITYFGVALGHRYGLLVKREWNRSHGDVAGTGDGTQSEAEQDAWALAGFIAEGKKAEFPDRYRRLRAARTPRSSRGLHAGTTA